MRILNVIKDGYPTFRPDVVALFGRYLPRLGIHTDLVTQASDDAGDRVVEWDGGTAILCRQTGRRTVDQLLAFSHDIRSLWRVQPGSYDALQVRDKVFAAVFAIWIARRRSLPVFYWMSFPMSEGYIRLAQEVGPSAKPFRWLFWMLKGYLGRWLLYRYVLPRCTHVFVQSDHMRSDVAELGISKALMTAVPMGVDLERPVPSVDDAALNERLRGRRVVAYLGTLDRFRRLDFLLEVIQRLRSSVPEVVLLMIGDSSEPEDRAWLERYAGSLGIAESVVWSGWVTSDEAWRWLAAAEVAVSLFPRGRLLDSASPTKVVEYMALGIPVVANDQPDQQKVLEESGAGICTAMDHDVFVTALQRILSNADLATQMRAAGPRYVAAERGYERIAAEVASVYRELVDSQVQ